MTPWVIDFLHTSKDVVGEPKTILEVGSLDVNGSARQVYEKKEAGFLYYGLDQVAGKGVDIVGNAHKIDKFFEPESMDLVICCETLEHDPEFWLTIEQMKKVLKPNGWLIITTPGFHFPQHDYPFDYYRYMGQTYRDVFFKDMRNVHVEEFFNLNSNNEGKPDWVGGWAQK